MAKLAKMKYRTVGGELKINTYNATISKKIVAESGIDPEKMHKNPSKPHASCV